jgi:hypothetical protein
MPMRAIAVNESEHTSADQRQTTETKEYPELKKKKLND